MSSKSYLITGANRGLGLGLVSALLRRDNILIVATVRDTASESSKTLNALPKGANSRIIVLKIDSASEGDAAQAVDQLKLEHNAGKLDVVIANSGIAKYYGPAVTTPLTDMASIPLPATAYGSSKAALNYITRKIHFEHPNSIVFPISPGWVQTDMGNMGAQAVGMKAAPVMLKDSIDGMLNKIDNATRETTSGIFQSFDETQYNW